MSHILTRIRAVVGGGIPAVLLLACARALRSAPEPTDPVSDSRLPVTVPTVQRVAAVLGVALVTVVLWRMFRVVGRGDSLPGRTRQRSSTMRRRLLGAMALIVIGIWMAATAVASAGIAG